MAETMDRAKLEEAIDQVDLACAHLQAMRWDDALQTLRRTDWPSVREAARAHLATLPPPMRSGTTYLCDMPGDGPWKLIRANGGLIAVSATHGLFSLAIEVGEKAVGACWKEMKPEAPE